MRVCSVTSLKVLAVLLVSTWLGSVSARASTEDASESITRLAESLAAQDPVLKRNCLAVVGENSSSLTACILSGYTYYSPRFSKTVFTFRATRNALQNYCFVDSNGYVKAENCVVEQIPD